MTQAELAEKASVTRQTIIALEAQKYSPSLELAFRIAKVFATKNKLRLESINLQSGYETDLSSNI